MGWYWLRPGGSEGPFSSEALAERLRAEPFPRSALVLDPRSGAWCRAGDVPELAAALPPTAARPETDPALASRAGADEVRRQGDRAAALVPWRGVLDSLPLAVGVLNSHRQLVWANEPLARLRGPAGDLTALGLRPGEALGCLRAFLDPAGCGASSFCESCGAARAIRGSLLGTHMVEECRVVRRLGSRLEALDLRVTARPVPGPGETFAVVAVQDVSHERRREVLERLFHHDVSNSATALRGAVELLGAVEGPAREELLGVVRTSTTRLLDEIQAHRTLLEAENGELQPRLAPLRAGTLLAGVVEGLARLPVARGRVLRLAEDSADVAFVSDPALVGRVLVNMVKNALEASEPGQEVGLRCRATASEVHLEVHNAAVMPADVQRQVFQRSFSTRGRGRGLGTYGMMLLCERYLGGRVSFTSAPGEGTTFVASLPREAPPPAA